MSSPSRSASTLTAREIFLFWLPLFSSWLLMTTEGPLLSAAINRLPNEVVMLAAMGIVFAVAVAIESPIINLLATATALVRDGHSFRLMRRFTLHWMAALTAAATLLATTPLFDFVIYELMGTPPEVGQWVRRGLVIMIPWSAAIAWRRFQQGVLITFGQPRKVAWGTAIRLTASGGTAITLALRGTVSGVEVGAYGLMAGVLAEAAYATWAVRPLHEDELAKKTPAPDAEGGGEEREALTYRELMAFHLPLASTSVLTLLAQPLVTAALARLSRPVETLAAWPLVFQFMLLMRAVALAWPEVVIALSKREGAREPLRRVSLVLTGISFVGMALLAWTPAADFYLVQIQSATGPVVEIAAWIFRWVVPLPALAVLVSWWRGRLIHRRRTGAVNRAMMVRVAATVAVLAAALSAEWSGATTAAMALVVPVAAEVLALRYSAGREDS